MPFISYGDYLNANQGDVGNMEKMLRDEEQAQLSGALNSTNAAGQEAKDSAYWGGSGEVSDYAAWKDSESKRTAARDFQSDIQNDAGQLNQLNKLGKGFGSLDAAFALGSNKSEKTRASLAEFMGYDAQKLDELASKYGDETEAARKDYDRELAAKTESDKKTAERGRWMKDRGMSEDQYWADIESQLTGATTNKMRDLTDAERAMMAMGQPDPRHAEAMGPETGYSKMYKYYMGSDPRQAAYSEQMRGKSLPQTASLAMLRGLASQAPRGSQQQRDLLAKARDLMGASGELQGEVGGAFRGINNMLPQASRMKGKYSSLGSYLEGEGLGGDGPEQGNYSGRLATGRKY